MRQTDIRQHHRLMPCLGGRGIISVNNICVIDCILILHVHAESLRKDERHKMRRSMKWMVVKTIWLASSNIYL